MALKIHSSLDFAFFDCDNHYYEAKDAFTRHIEKEYAKRTMQWVIVNGKVEGVLRTQTYIAFKTYSKHDLEAAFSIGLED